MNDHWMAPFLYGSAIQDGQHHWTKFNFKNII